MGTRRGFVLFALLAGCSLGEPAAESVSGRIAAPGSTDDGGGGPVGDPGDTSGTPSGAAGVPHERGENDFVDPADDALVTFGVDVDTASYAIMRRDVLAGLLPLPDVVRTEEFLNYFDYRYEPPPADGADPFAVHLDLAPSPFGEGLQLLRVGIKGKELAPRERGAANLVFLVDVSGSMQAAHKLPLVKETLRILVDQLREDDTIGLVTYAGDARIALQPTSAVEREVILAAIDELRADGSTNGEAGIRMAYDLAEAHFREGGINRVVLCTDGDLNVGLDGWELVELVETFRDRGVFLTALGFGTDGYDDAQLESLADQGNGNYAYIDTRAEADRVLRTQLLGTLAVIAKDVKLQVAIDPEFVIRYRLLGYENRAIADEDFVDPHVDTGDIGSGHDVTALIELELDPAVNEPGLVAAPVATVHVRYKEPGGAEDLQLERSITASGRATSLEAAPASLRFAAAVAEYAEILRRSNHSEGARFSEVLDLAAGAAEDDADRLELLELIELARGLWEERIGPTR